METRLLVHQMRCVSEGWSNSRRTAAVLRQIRLAFAAQLDTLDEEATS